MYKIKFKMNVNQSMLFCENVKKKAGKIMRNFKR